MVDKTLVAKIEELEKEYERLYGKKPVITEHTLGLTQRKMIEILELMISDNISFVVAYGKIKGIPRKR